MEEFDFPEMDPNRIITEDNPMNYVIINVSELNNVNFDEIFNNSDEDLRYSLDGTKTFLRFRGEVPTCIQNLETKSEILTSEEINDILHTEEWNF
jgi:hypothetical protein